MVDRSFVSLADLRPALVRWLWPSRIPLGALTLLEGDPGQSKSVLTCDVISRLTAGKPMPDCAAGQAPAGAVLLQAEDHLGTVQANLRAAGADLSRIAVYDKTRFEDRPLSLPDDLPLIKAAAAEFRAQLIVIDPVTAFLVRNPNVEQHVRGALAPLAAFAERTGIAIVLVRHLTKGGSANPLYRGAGSIAIMGAARSALRVGGDPGTGDGHQHVLVQIKTNLAAAASLTYRTVNRWRHRHRVPWGEPVHSGGGRR